MEDELEKSNQRLKKFKEMIDEMSIGGAMLKRGLFRKPLFIQGVPPPAYLIAAYIAEQTLNEELKTKR